MAPRIDYRECMTKALAAAGSPFQICVIRVGELGPDQRVVTRFRDLLLVAASR
jgi:hypothetical protein